MNASNQLIEGFMAGGSIDSCAVVCVRDARLDYSIELREKRRSVPGGTSAPGEQTGGTGLGYALPGQESHRGHACRYFVDASRPILEAKDT
jgi:hypothetical protein